MLDLSYVQKLREFFDSNPCLDFDSRSLILYPLLDRLYTENEKLDLKLKNGLVLNYLYKSNIAKEILLRDQEVPDHAWEPMTTLSVELAIRYRAGSILIGGAYFGDHALVAALEINKIEGNHSVLCIEPNKEQRNMLKSNAIENKLENKIKLIDSVLWDRSEQKFDLAASDSHACISPNPGANHTSVTIDQLLITHEINNVSLILLDIEGSEERALEGANTILSARKEIAPIIIVEIHKNYVDWSDGLNDTSLVKHLRSHDYHVFALRDCQSNWNLKLDRPEIIPLDQIYLEGPAHGFNLIASKNLDFFTNQGYRIVKNVSPKYLRHRDHTLHLPIKTDHGSKQLIT